MANVRGAAARLESRGLFITGRSSVYETPAWGYTSANKYYNAVIAVTWVGTLLELQFQAEQIERDLWRIKKHNPFGKGYADRTIDIDFLWFDGVVSSTPSLTIPHPLAHQRAFVLVPWCELTPDLILRERTLTQWLAALPKEEVQAIKRVQAL